MTPRSGNLGNGAKRRFFYGWTVVAGAFLITAITAGSFYSYGVFFTPVLTEFGWTRALTSGVSLVGGLTYAATIPFAGLLADRWGFPPVMAIAAALLGLGFAFCSQVETAWQLYLFAGFLPGCGACLATALPLAMVARWFSARQGLALGIAAAGVGFGTAVVPLMAAYLISGIGWRATYAVVGVLICLTCVPASVITMRPPRNGPVGADREGGVTDAGAPPPGDGNRGFSLVQAVRTTQFWSLFAVFGLCILGLAVTMIHVVPCALDRGLPAVTAAGLLTAVGVFSFIGRLVSGAVSDRVGTRVVLAACLGLQGIMMFWLVVADEVWMLYLFAVLFGVGYGGCIPLIPRLTAQLFGVRSMGAVFGGISVADGIGFAVGPFLAGYAFDVTGSYDLSFLAFGGGVLVAVILTLLLRPPAAQDSAG